jgi:hypothetical protein
MGSYFSRIASAPASEEEQQCLFVTLGMIVQDEIHFPAQDPIKDVIGGSGAYCKPQCYDLRAFYFLNTDFANA